MAKISEVDRICADLQAERDRIDALLAMLRASAAKAPKRARKAKAVVTTDEAKRLHERIEAIK